MDKQSSIVSRITTHKSSPIQFVRLRAPADNKHNAVITNRKALSTLNIKPLGDINDNISTYIHHHPSLFTYLCLYVFLDFQGQCLHKNVWSQKRSRERSGGWPAASESRDPGAGAGVRPRVARLRRD